MDFISQLFPEEILYALGWTVVHSLWQAFAVAMLLSALLLGWQNRSARLRCAAANLALGVTLLLAVVTFFTLLRQASGEAELASALTTDAEALGAYFVEEPALPFFDYFNQHLPLIVTAWLAGMLFFLLKMMGGLLYIQRLKHRCNLPMTGEWQERLGSLAGELGLTKMVRLAESALVRAPVLVGWAKPVILMPIGAVNCLSAEQVEAILAHELAHVARHDYLLNLFQSVAEILFYFNPAVWWISANIRTERENCCDDVAVQLCGNSLSYARALVALQEMHSATPAFAMTFSKNRNQLLSRVKRILQQPQNKSNVMEKLSATLLLLAAVVALSVQASTPFGKLLERAATSSASEGGDLEYVLPADGERYLVRIEDDTIPAGKKGTWSYHRSDDGEEIEINMKDGEITHLKVNGEVIPKEDYGKYEGLVEETLANLPEPPMPPDAPAPGLWETPPTPPTAPTPPAPGFFETAPAPPAPPRPGSGSRKITTQRDGNSTTIIIETREGDEPVKIKVKDKKGSVTINGQEIRGLKKGDKTVIIERLDGDAPGAFYLGEMGDLAELPELADFPEMHGFHVAPGEWGLLLPESEELMRLHEGRLLDPKQLAEWEADRERMLAELHKRLAEQDHLGGEWRKEFNEQMERELGGERLRELELQHQELFEQRHQMQQERLQQMQELREQELQQVQERMEEMQRQIEERVKQKQKSRSNKKLMSNTKGI